MAKPELTIVIVNFNTSALLEPMFDALLTATRVTPCQTIIIDNASQDDSVAVILKKYPDATLIRNKTNVGFGRANNQALNIIQGRNVLLLNTDAFVSSASIITAINYLDSHDTAGVAGVRLLGRDGSLQPSCRYFPTPYNVFLSKTGLAKFLPKAKMVDNMDWDHLSTRECDWVPGCFYMIKKRVLDEVGLFDPRFFLYYEEVDHCKRVKSAGWDVAYIGETTCIHLGGESAASISNLSKAGRQISKLQIESEILYFRKHYGVAGLLAHITLSILGDSILVMKSIVKRRGIAAAWSDIKNSIEVLQHCMLTKFGVKPTR